MMNQPFDEKIQYREKTGQVGKQPTFDGPQYLSKTGQVGKQPIFDGPQKTGQVGKQPTFEGPQYPSKTGQVGKQPIFEGPQYPNKTGQVGKQPTFEGPQYPNKNGQVGKQPIFEGHQKTGQVGKQPTFEGSQYLSKTDQVGKQPIFEGPQYPSNTGQVGKQPTFEGPQKTGQVGKQPTFEGPQYPSNTGQVGKQPTFEGPQKTGQVGKQPTFEGPQKTGQVGKQPIFEEPQSLIETGQDGHLHVVETVIEQLQQLDGQLVVVAITGIYRTGKSYLMNRLAGKNTGFAIDRETKGIWIWVRRHPKLSDTYLVLLDTEGLVKPEIADANYDNWILTLSILLSSTFVYNSMGVINDDMITRLGFVSEICKKIKIRESDSEGQDADFHVFIMALRDFSLELDINGKSVTADEYLDHLLNMEKGRSREFIESRKCIRKYFKPRKCFTFDRPVMKTRQLKDLETLNEHQLNEDFLDNSKAFTDYVFNTCPIMKLPNGTKINGPMFASLVGTYVSSIRQGALPCVQNTAITMAEQENRKAIEGAVRLYRKLVEAGVDLPTETEQQLTDINSQCKKQAISYFTSNVVMDTEGHFQKTLNEELMSVYISYDEKNRRLSREKCQKLLDDLDTPIKQKVQDEFYTAAGGFLKFQNDLEAVKDAYKKQTGLGVEKEQVLDEYINATATMSASILAADKKMTEEEKKIQEMKQNVTRLEYQRKKDMKEIPRLQQRFDCEMAALEETKILLETKHEEEIKAICNQHTQKKKMQGQEHHVKEGFEKDTQKKKLEIENTKGQFMEEQTHIHNLQERERQHQQELMEAKLEKQKGENQVKEEKIRLMEESKIEPKEAHEATVEKMSQMNMQIVMQIVNAIERMHQEQLKAQHQMLVMMGDMEHRRMEQDMERARLEAERRKEEREMQMKWEKELLVKLVADRR